MSRATMRERIPRNSLHRWLRKGREYASRCAPSLQQFDVRSDVVQSVSWLLKFSRAPDTCVFEVILLRCLARKSSSWDIKGVYHANDVLAPSTVESRDTSRSIVLPVRLCATTHSKRLPGNSPAGGYRPTVLYDTTCTGQHSVLCVKPATAKQ